MSISSSQNQESVSFAKSLFESDAIGLKDKLLIVNPMHNYWSVQLSCEIAIQASAWTNKIKWIDISPANKKKYQINSQDFVNKFIRRDNLSHLNHIFNNYNIDFELKKQNTSSRTNLDDIMNVDQLLKLTYNSHPIGSVVFSGICSKLQSTNFTYSRFKKLIDIYINYCISIVDVLESEVLKFKPTKIFTINDRIMGSALAVSVGRKFNLSNTVFYWGSDKSRIIGYSDSLYNIDQWQENVQKNFENNPPNQNDKSLVLNSIKNLGLEPINSSIQFNQYQKKGKKLTLEGSEKICVFYATSTYEHSPLLFIKLKNGFKGQFEAFEVLQKVCQKYDYTLILKHHPSKRRLIKWRKRNVHNWEKFKIDKGTIELPSNSDVDTYELLKQADINVTWGSTVGLESLMAGRRTLILGNLAWLNKKWGVHAWNQKEIENFFNSASPNIDREEFLPWFWYLKKFGSPCKFTFLDHKSVQILDTNFFDLRLIFLLIYKAIKVLPKVFQNRVNEII